MEIQKVEGINQLLLSIINWPMLSDKGAMTTSRHLLEGKKMISGTKPWKDRTSHWSKRSFCPSPT